MICHSKNPTPLQMEKKKDYGELLKKRRYDPNKKPPPEQVIFIIESKNIGTLQNFVTLTGMQKSGKTTFLSAIMAAALTNSEILSMRVRLPEKKRKVVYFDTEQGDNDFFRTMDKVKSFCCTDHLNPEHFASYNVREDEPKDMVFMVRKALEVHTDCGLLVVDGILDLIESYNDEAQSKKLINVFKQLTKIHNVLAVLTLHKGKTTSNTLGHLGSMADRAAQSVLMVEKNKDTGTFLLKADYLRSADDFTPIEIFFNKNNNTWQQGIFQPEEERLRPDKVAPFDLPLEIHREHVTRIFSFSEELSYELLRKDIIELYNQPKKWAGDCVKHLLKEGLVFKFGSIYTNRKQVKLFIQN